jgi:hypothetical protein
MMAKEKTQDIPEIAPKVVEHLVKEADKAGVPPAVAKWIIKDAIADGVAPDEVADVVKEAIEFESEDQQPDKQQPTEKDAPD